METTIPERADWTQTIHRSASGDVTFSYQGWAMNSTDLTWAGCGHQHPTPFMARACAVSAHRERQALPTECLVCRDADANVVLTDCPNRCDAGLIHDDEEG